MHLVLEFQHFRFIHFIVVTVHCIYILQALEPSKEPGTKKSSFRTEKQQTLYCLEPDCMKQFTKESQLLRHLAGGQDDTTVDKTKRMWAKRCSSLRHNQPNLTADTVNIDDDQFVENVGYALRKQRKNTRFPVKVKDYLNK